MLRDPIVSTNIAVLIFSLSVIASIALIVMKRRKRKRHIILNELKKKKYSRAQLFGIVGIIFFIFPIFWIVGVMLLKGAFVIFILILGILNPPEFFSMIAKSVFIFSTMVLFFTGIYIGCDLLWPDRYGKTDSL